MNIFNVAQFGVASNPEVLCTSKLQAILDLCKEDGGQVVFPKGIYRLSSVYVHSNTTIYLESGAYIIGSDEISDYFEFDIPEGTPSLHDFIALKPQVDKYGFTAEGYRLAMFSAVNESNISFIGEQGSLIDGVHCFNAAGDQGYRGPHTIWMTNCSSILFEGITLTRSGNFGFQLDCCSDIRLKGVDVSRGDDGIHLNGSENIAISDCRFECGDDCIAGLNVINLRVDNCFISSACDIFRLGGRNILIEGCRIKGPCSFPHRVSTAISKNYDLPDFLGRRNCNVFFCFFASDVIPMDSENIVIRDCEIIGVDRLLYDSRDFSVFQSGGVLRDITFENVTATELLHPCFYNRNTSFRFINSVFCGQNGQAFELFEE